MDTESKTGLVQQLRSEFFWRDVKLKELAYGAADEIERLRAEVKEAYRKGWRESKEGGY